MLYQNQGDGTFTLVTVGADLGGTSQDAVFVDYDNDGDLDLAITQESATNVLLQNGTDDENYLKVRLIGHGPAMTNKAAIGVRVDLYQSNGTTFIARREIGVARGLGGTEPIWVHFGGVTKTTTYVVKAHFVSGVVDTTVVPQSVSTTIGSVTILQMVTITERKPNVSVWAEVDPR
ncbi:MAG: VCBS repeat-containing protein [Planctomycetes bacterium]|nr:VCBS repeat-containing protein [Planctomycetota bacterium]